MNDTTTMSIAKGGFSLSAELMPGCLRLKLQGTGDGEMTSPLTVFLRSAHEEAACLKLGLIACDLSELYFLNSSGIKCLLVWLKEVRNGTCCYKVTFLTNPKLAWQRRSLEAVRTFAGSSVSVEEA